MTLARTLVFRAKLSKRTHASLEAFLEEMRHLWNGALEERIDAYRKAGVSITWVDQFKSLTEIRRVLPEYANVSVKAQRSVLKRLDRAFQSFFRRVAVGQTPGFPRFRSKHRGLRSFEVPAPAIRRHGRWNVGRASRGSASSGSPAKSRERPRSCGSSRPRCAWPCIWLSSARSQRSLTSAPGSASMSASARASPCRPARPSRAAGWIAAPWSSASERLSRAKRGSKARCKKRLALAREWQRVTERERGVLHELTADLVREHGARIYVEDLKIPNMVRNRRLARSISEQNWGGVVALLTYKAEEAGGWVRKVPPHNTSQKCSGCGAMPVVKLTLADRTYECAACGAYRRPRRERSEECPCSRARARPAGRGSPGAPQGGRRARCGSQDQAARCGAERYPKGGGVSRLPKDISPLRRVVALPGSNQTPFGVGCKGITT